MNNEKLETANKQIRLVTNLSIFSNIGLCILKVVVGMFAGSISLVVDGFHSLSDLVTDFAVLVGVKMGSKSPDEKHPYGHGRFETFATFIIAVFIIMVGAAAIHRAAMDIAADKTTRPTVIVLFAAAASVVVKELLYQISKKTALKYKSSIVLANAWHHRSDALSSVAVIIGYGTLFFGFQHGDQIGAVVVGLMVVLVGVHIIGRCIHELTETAVDEKTAVSIKEIIESDDSIRSWHKLRSRTVGRELFLDLHILVDPLLNIKNAHRISDDLEDKLHESIDHPVNIIIHVEPDIPSLRK